MRPARGFAALLCDMDGVVRHFEDKDALEDRFAVPRGTLMDVAFAPDRVARAVTGAIGDERWRAEIADEIGRRVGDAARAAAMVEAWSASTGVLDERVVALLAEVRARVPVALVSNATTRLERDLDVLGIGAAFDAVVNSARVGVAKPDRRIYLIAAARLGADPAACVFVDDAPENVEGARQAGMAGILFEGPERLRAALGLA